MTDSRSSVKYQFQLKLQKFLAESSEFDLTEAYLLGRDAIRQGMEELDLMNFYYEAMAEIHIDTLNNGHGKKFKSSVDFLSECLAPFAIRSRGHQDLIRKLDLRNSQLQREVNRRKQTEAELSESKEHFQKLIENCQDIITILNSDGHIRYVSPSLKRIMGHEPEELIGENIGSYIHPENRPRVSARLKELHKTVKETDLSEIRFKHRDGTWKYLESIAKYVPEEETHLDEAPYIIVNSRDVSERVRAREKLQKREQQLLAAQQIAQMGNWEWDFRSDNLKWSRELSKIYGIDHQNAPGSLKNESQLVHPDDLQKAKRAFKKALIHRGELNFEYRILQPDGAERILHVRGEVKSDADGNPHHLIGTCQDITNLKEVEKKLQAYSQLLKNLYAKQDRVREDERSRVAREIHDELGQMLTVLKMELFLLKERSLEEEDQRISREFAVEIEKVIERFDTIINSVQRITTELRPEVLDTLGLTEAIEWQCRKFEAETGIQISFKSVIQSVDPVDDERSTAIFRILQETFRNIQEHSGASKVDVHLKKDHRNVVLIVKDNGKGIPREKINAPDSLGIIGMHERSQFLGGDIRFKGNKTEGTTVILKIPF